MQYVESNTDKISPDVSLICEAVFIKFEIATVLLPK
jgi:hypothetical protein